MLNLCHEKNLFLRLGSHFHYAKLFVVKDMCVNSFKYKHTPRFWNRSLHVFVHILTDLRMSLLYSH